MTASRNRLILGAGVTGLAAGYASGLPVFEASSMPGGICSSYYLEPNSSEPNEANAAHEETYHFEIGGGHWIFGGDPAVKRLMHTLTPMRSYQRKSAVYFADENLYVPYPVQNHLRFLDERRAAKALAEMAANHDRFSTMKEWLEASFGKTLCDYFFFPFHELYTAGLYEKIAPQDVYKSPVDIELAIRGTFNDAPAVGYNVTFLYPQNGLDELARKLAGRCDIRYGKRAMEIDIKGKTVHFENGDTVKYGSLISTLPLNKMLDMTGLSVDEPADPYTSVLVLNIGAVKGKQCPEEHWLYHPSTKAGFHRVGFYSAVDKSFLPKSARESNNRVSIYVERAFVGGTTLTEQEVADYTNAVIAELQSWGYIENVEVAHPTWIDVAYTWSLPGSKWKQKALKKLEEHDIYQVGRYGRWIFQGIADSIRDGLMVGGSFKI